MNPTRTLGSVVLLMLAACSGDPSSNNGAASGGIAPSTSAGGGEAAAGCSGAAGAPVVLATGLTGAQAIAGDAHGFFVSRWPESGGLVLETLAKDGSARQRVATDSGWRGNEELAVTSGELQWPDAGIYDFTYWTLSREGSTRSRWVMQSGDDSTMDAVKQIAVVDDSFVLLATMKDALWRCLRDTTGAWSCGHYSSEGESRNEGVAVAGGRVLYVPHKQGWSEFRLRWVAVNRNPNEYETPHDVFSQPLPGLCHTIAADEQHVFWHNGDSNALEMANWDGSGRRTIATTPVVTHIAVDAQGLYWLTKEALWRADTNGDNARVMAKTNPGPRRFVLDSTGIYWITATGELMKAPK